MSKMDNFKAKIVEIKDNVVDWCEDNALELYYCGSMVLLTAVAFWGMDGSAKNGYALGYAAGKADTLAVEANQRFMIEMAEATGSKKTKTEVSE